MPRYAQSASDAPLTLQERKRSCFADNGRLVPPHPHIKFIKTHHCEFTKSRFAALRAVCKRRSAYVTRTKTFLLRRQRSAHSATSAYSALKNRRSYIIAQFFKFVKRFFQASWSFLKKAPRSLERKNAFFSLCAWRAQPQRVFLLADMGIKKRYRAQKRRSCFHYNKSEALLKTLKKKTIICKCTIFLLTSF